MHLIACDKLVVGMGPSGEDFRGSITTLKRVDIHEEKDDANEKGNSAELTDCTQECRGPPKPVGLHKEASNHDVNEAQN